MSRVTLEDMRAFLAVADARGFVRAAEQLFITQSALSRRITKLEAAIGARLFDRDSRNVELTALGRTFVPIATRMVHGFERSMDEIRDVVQLRAGTVTIGSMLTVANHLLAGVLARFAQRYPGIKVRVLDDFGPRLLAAVDSGEAEFAVGHRDEGDAPTAATDAVHQAGGQVRLVVGV